MEDENVDLVSSLPITYLYEPIENEKIASLEPYINANKLNLSNIYEPTINISKKIGNNEIYSLSPSFQNKLFIINNDIFRKLDIDVPKENLTWSEVKSLSLQIQSKIRESKEEIYPISLGPAGKKWSIHGF